MHAVNFPGAIYIGPPKVMGEKCYGIYAQPITEGVEFPFWLMAWQPSKEDIEAFNRGEPMYLQITTGARKDAEGNIQIAPLVPHVPFTLDAEGKSNQSDE